MGLIDRFGSVLSSTGSAIQRVGGALRGPRTTIAPSVDLPGVTPWPTGQRSNSNEALREALNTIGALMGRVSYDAGPSWTRFSSYPATDLTPEKISGAQQEAVAGYPLRWMEMIEQVLSRDSHLGGIAQQRVEDVIKGSWRLVRSTNDDVAACIRSFCEESVRSIEGFEDGLGWLLLSNAYGYNALETTWKWDRVTFPGPKGQVIGPVDVVVPARVDAVHPKHFRFDLRTDEPLLWLGSDQVSLPFGKFIFVKGEGHHPITERRGYMWPCIWLSMFRSIGWAGWAVYVERFGLPTPLIKYDGTVEQYSEHKSLWEQMLQWLGRGYGGIVPKTTEVEFAKSEGAGRASDPHSALSDACDAAQSVRVLGATLTAKIGNVGSFSASSAHLEVKYAKEEADARRLWSSIRSDLLQALVMFNAVNLARAIEAASIKASPDMIVRRIPRGLHRVPREVDPLQRGELVGMAINEWGLKVGKEALYDEFNLPQPMGDDDVAAGEPQQVTSGGKVVGSVEAATEGAEAPKEEEGDETKDDAGKGTGDGGGSGKKAPAKLSRDRSGARVFSTSTAPTDDEELIKAILILIGEDAEAFDHTTQPRDAKGRFAAVAGAKATVAQHIAKHLTDNGHAAEARGSTVHLKNGGKIEIGNKGEREYRDAGAKVQKAVESHLREHTEKHVRDWASKTAPPPPPPRPARKVDPEKAAARAKAKQEKQAAREQARAEKLKARETKKAERAAVKAERVKAIAERKATREAKRAERIAAVKAVGAPVTADGKVDASKVPGATSTFKPPTSIDPENSFRGRSFYARSAKEMKAEFLSAVGRGGTNEEIIRSQLGHNAVHDSAQWDAIREKYEAPHVATLDQALDVLAKTAAARNPLRRPDWRDFDLDTLRECAGLEGVDLPGWLHEARDHREQQEQMAAYYGDHEAYGHDEGGDHTSPSDDDLSDIPF